MTEGPYYIVKEGTNIRETLFGKNVHGPKIFDTEEIAQTHIDGDVEYRKRVGLTPQEARVPISVAEYNKKYAKIMDTKEY